MHATTGTLAAHGSAGQPDALLHDQQARTELAALVDIAAQTVAPLWPLDSAIAVNPLSGFEEQPFEQAIGEAAALFGARASLSVPQWRRLLGEGRIAEIELRKVAVAALGGLDEAFATLGPDLNAYDLLLARLKELPAAERPAVRPALAPGLAILARWLGVYFDRNASVPLPARENGLYACLAQALRHDLALRRLADAAGRALIAEPADDPLALLIRAQQQAGVTAGDRAAWLRFLVTRLPGWAGHLRWRSEHGAAAASLGAPATMADLVALVALVCTATGVSRTAAPAQAPHVPAALEPVLLARFGLPANAPAGWGPAARARLARVTALDDAALGLIFQQAAEASYAVHLSERLEKSAAVLTRTAQEPRPDAQLVFCIDVRSEPMRRAIEAQGSYETLGYAGFFGLPIAIEPACSAAPRNQLPVLLRPAHVVAERAVPGREGAAQALLARLAAKDDARSMLATTKSGSLGFATAEATGPLAAITMLARTLMPRLADRFARAIAGGRGDALMPQACNDHGMSLTDRIGYAKGMFALTGLGAETARLVVLAGHGGCTTNNAFAASLDCGACGGHPGGPNARLMAAILNDPQVRAGLAAEGIDLPADSWFLAAQHDTTQDVITLFDRHVVPVSHAEDLARLDATLTRAGAAVREERGKTLGRSAADLLTGAVHWGEVRPEWGLSGNAAFIVAPRSLTRSVDLGGSAFLHSYDWQKDADGSALAAIMTAPMIVAQWINNQYLFATIDNEVFGAGDKTTQNVIGGFGVVQGNCGDLCTGLPRQSLFRDDGVPYHTPRRLAVVVVAPLQRVQDIVLAHDSVGRLVENGWINLMVIDPWKHRTHNWVRGDWVARPC